MAEIICDRYNEFINYYKLNLKRSKNTIEAYSRNLKSFLKYIKEVKSKNKSNKVRKITDYWLKQITREDILNYQKKLIADGYKESSANNKLCAVYEFFRYLIAEEIIEKNPFVGIRKLKVPIREMQYLTEEEVKKLISVINNVMDKAMFMLLINNGLRVSEVIKLTVNQIKLAINNKILVLIGKGNKQRKVFLTKHTIIDLNNWLEKRKDMNIENNYLFINRNKQKLNRATIENKLKKYGKLVGITEEKLHCHALRHTFASIEIRKNVNIAELQHLLGHNSITTTQRYIHINDDKLREASDKVDIY